LDAWVYETTVKPTGQTKPPDVGSVGSISSAGCAAGSEVTFSLSRPVAFRIIPQLNPPVLIVDLFGCVLAPYWVRQFPDDALIRIIQPWQEESEWVRVRVELNNPAIVGYRAYYRGNNTLVIEVRRPYAGPELAGKTIVLDPGHGGGDSGAKTASGLAEKTVNLAIAARAATLLTQAGAHVILTRTSDTQVGPPNCSQAAELEARLLVGVKHGADLFVSIHNNHAGSITSSAAGVEAYYWTPFSHLLAKRLAAAVSASLGTPNRFVGWRPFHVLRGTDCPRALVECAYMSHPDEAEYVAKPEFVERAAVGIVAGIKQFLAETAAYAAGAQ
jgi:N-acetylmuramoyl-L-alanine amidase